MLIATMIATRLRLVLGVVVLLTGPLAALATAQNRPGPSAEIAAGWVGFADDGVVSEILVGGAVRFYLSPRLSVGPELVYIQGDNHSHVVVTGNVTWDLLSPTNGRPASVTPFFVAGGGLFQTRERFPSGGFSSSEGAFTAGGGVRAALGDRVTIGADARIGWELHLRVGAVVGVRLGGR
jgi:Outer membrane protein beta-barrel domain